MSLLFHDRLTLVVVPDGVNLFLQKKGWRSPVQTLGALAVDGHVGEPWDAVMRTLGEWLAKGSWRHTVVNVVMADALTRYTLLPWSEEIRKPSEMAALARIHFDALYGVSDVDMTIVSQRGVRYGQAGIACAIETSWLVALHAVLGVHKMRAASIEPRFVHSVNRWRRRIAGDGLLVSVEYGQCVLAVMRRGAWHSIRTVKLSGAMPQALLTVIERELVLQGEGDRTPVFLDLSIPLDTAAMAQMERFHILGHGLDSGECSKVSMVGVM